MKDPDTNADKPAEDNGGKFKPAQVLETPDELKHMYCAKCHHSVKHHTLDYITGGFRSVGMAFCNYDTVGGVCPCIGPLIYRSKEPDMSFPTEDELNLKYPNRNLIRFHLLYYYGGNKDLLRKSLLTMNPEMAGNLNEILDTIKIRGRIRIPVKGYVGMSIKRLYENSRLSYESSCMYEDECRLGKPKEIVCKECNGKIEPSGIPYWWLARYNEQWEYDNKCHIKCFHNKYRGERDHAV